MGTQFLKNKNLISIHEIFLTFWLVGLGPGPK